MWRFFKPSPLLLLIAALTLQRGNAELGCDSRGRLQDTSDECWADDINRAFGGLLDGCIDGYASSIFIRLFPPPPLPFSNLLP